jgi:hypothetical protein
MRLACDVLIIADGEERLIDRFRLDAREDDAARLEIMDIMASETLTREPPDGWMLEYRGSEVSNEEWLLLPSFGD